MHSEHSCCRDRLFRRSSLGILHYTLLLVLFGAAAAKAQHTPLLSAMLLSELPSLFFLAGKLQVRAGEPPSVYPVTWLLTPADWAWER